MWFFVGTYVGLIAVFLFAGKLPDYFEKKEYRKLCMVLLLVNSVAIFIYFSDTKVAREGAEFLERNTYGGGKRIEELRVLVEGEKEDIKLQVIVEEKKYSKKEIESVFQEAMEMLDKKVLGRNKNFQEIREKIYMPKTIKENAVTLTWEMSRYDLIDLSGELAEEKLSSQGQTMTIIAIMNCQGTEKVYARELTVFQPQKTEKEKIVEAVQTRVEEESEQAENEPVLKLPKAMGEKELQWKKETDKRSFFIIGLGLIGVVFLFLLKKEKKKKELQEKQIQMQIDFSEILTKLILLLGAGMMIRTAWEWIVKDYQGRKKEVRYAYEEMIYFCNEIQTGIPEIEGYERFGRRCALPEYLKLAALLSQGQRRGSRQLIDLLSVESIQAFAQRKRIAKKKGEEASTKLLIPIFLMLLIVLIIVVIPAFLSMQT